MSTREKSSKKSRRSDKSSKRRKHDKKRKSSKRGWQRPTGYESSPLYTDDDELQSLRAISDSQKKLKRAKMEERKKRKQDSRKKRTTGVERKIRSKGQSVILEGDNESSSGSLRGASGSSWESGYSAHDSSGSSRKLDNSGSDASYPSDTSRGQMGPMRDIEYNPNVQKNSDYLAIKTLYYIIFSILFSFFASFNTKNTKDDKVINIILLLVLVSIYLLINYMFFKSTPEFIIFNILFIFVSYSIINFVFIDKINGNKFKKSFIEFFLLIGNMAIEIILAVNMA